MYNRRSYFDKKSNAPLLWKNSFLDSSNSPSTQEKATSRQRHGSMPSIGGYSGRSKSTHKKIHRMVAPSRG